jgi:iron uptake system component EfeO
MRRSRVIHPVFGALLSAVLAACSSSGPARTDPTPTTGTVWQHDAVLRTAVAGYRTYVNAQLDRLAAATNRLEAALAAGDRAAAERAYGRARPFYERIEPVAEIWGSLDLHIDGRINDFVPRTAFAGFHRIEQLLWTGQRSAPTAATLTRSANIKTTLVSAVGTLRARARAAQYTPLQLTSGATELLNEIQSSKVTGEEERYSHIDLVDFAANVAGVREVVDVFMPALRARDPQLLAEITTRLRQVDLALDRFRAQPGYDGTGFVRFTQVSTAQRRTLAALVQALAEPVALLTGALAS